MPAKRFASSSACRSSVSAGFVTKKLLICPANGLPGYAAPGISMSNPWLINSTLWTAPQSDGDKALETPTHPSANFFCSNLVVARKRPIELRLYEHITERHARIHRRRERLRDTPRASSADRSPCCTHFGVVPNDSAWPSPSRAGLRSIASPPHPSGRSRKGSSPKVLYARQTSGRGSKLINGCSDHVDPQRAAASRAIVAPFSCASAR